MGPEDVQAAYNNFTQQKATALLLGSRELFLSTNSNDGRENSPSIRKKPQKLYLGEEYLFLCQCFWGVSFVASLSWKVFVSVNWNSLSWILNGNQNDIVKGSVSIGIYFSAPSYYWLESISMWWVWFHPATADPLDCAPIITGYFLSSSADFSWKISAKFFTSSCFAELYDALFWKSIAQCQCQQRWSQSDCFKVSTPL